MKLEEAKKVLEGMKDYIGCMEENGEEAAQFFLDLSDRIDEEKIQEVIRTWHRKHAGYFITNEILKDESLSQAIVAYLKGDKCQ